jgi:hypothetical protein
MQFHLLWVIIIFSFVIMSPNVPNLGYFSSYYEYLTINGQTMCIKSKSRILVIRCICIYFHYRNPSLGLATKVKACKSAGQKGSPGVTFHAFGSAKECEGMNPHIRRTLESLESDYKGQNALDQGVLNIIGNLLDV